MDRTILWIEDDYSPIKGLLRPIEKMGFTVDVAMDAVSGYQKALKWENYCLIIIDLIIPITKGNEFVPDIVKEWETDETPGLRLLKWLINGVKAKCPIIVLTVVKAPTDFQELQKDGRVLYINKGGLLPSKLKEIILDIVEIEE